MQLKSISSSNKGLYTVSPAKRVMLSVSQLCKSIVSGVQFPRTAVHPLPVAADSARWLGFTPYTTRDPTLSISIYLSIYLSISLHSLLTLQVSGRASLACSRSLRRITGRSAIGRRPIHRVARRVEPPLHRKHGLPTMATPPSSPLPAGPFPSDCPTGNGNEMWADQTSGSFIIFVSVPTLVALVGPQGPAITTPDDDRAVA